MNVLALETSGSVGSVAACRDGDALVEDVIETGMDHGRMLVPLVDRVVRAAGWNKRRDIALIAVSQGPGSFTGLRVGITCAKTLAVFLECPLVGVCSFDALVENVPAEAERALTVLDAKRGEVYAAAYERRQGAFQRVHAPSVLPPEEALAWLARPCHVIGDGLARHAEAFQADGLVPVEPARWRVRAAVVARLGLDLFRQGHRDDPLTLEPIYLRLPEAEEKRLRREGLGA